MPAGLRLYAIGDIHVRVDLLARLHVMIQGDASSHSEAARKAVVYLGDYIDRGLVSRKVVELLLDASLPCFEVVHLKVTTKTFFFGLWMTLQSGQTGSPWARMPLPSVMGFKYQAD